MARRCLMKQRFDVPICRHHSVGEETLLRELLNEARSGQSTALRPEDRTSAGYWATLLTMANPGWSNCSISQQDCTKYNNNSYQGSVPFTSTSCVPYPPWYQGDQGVCGWKGAPCTTLELSSNCSASNFLSRV